MTIQSCQRQVCDADARKRLGFTLVEMAIAAALAAILFLSVFAAVSNSYSILTITRQNLRATQIMETRFEGIRLEAWASNTNEAAQLFSTNYVPATFTENFYPEGINNTNNFGITYYGTVSVVQLTNAIQQTNVFGSTIPSYVTNLALVTITLAWTNTTSGIDAEGTSHSRSMSTLVSMYGMQNYIYIH